MQKHPKQQQSSLRSARNYANVTSAVGMEESVGRRRARQHSFFTQTIIWMTGLICIAFLLATLVQAWSNNSLMQRVQDAQVILQQKQDQHSHLQQDVNHYKDPTAIENEARQRLGYVRPGEQSVVVVNSSHQKETRPIVVQSSMQQQGFWKDWWRTLFGK